MKAIHTHLCYRIIILSFSFWVSKGEAAPPSKQQPLLLDAPPLHQPFVYPTSPSHSLSPPISPQASAPSSGKATKQLTVRLSVPKRARRKVPITITWNEPMISPTQVGQPAKPNVEFSPPIKGSWRWQSPQSIIFYPDPRWPRSSRIDVTLKGPIQSISGAQITDDFQRTEHITTPLNYVSRTQLIRVQGKQVDRWLRYLSSDTLIEVCTRFEAPDQSDSLYHLYQIKADQLPEEIPIKQVDLPDISSSRCRHFQVDQALPPYSSFRMSVWPGLTTLEGPLPQTKHYHKDFKSVPRFALKSVGLSRTHLDLSFNLPSLSSQLRPHLALLPPHLDPNNMSKVEIAKHDLLTTTSSSIKARTASRDHSFTHRVTPKAKASIWLHVPQIEKGDGNTLDRSKLLTLVEGEAQAQAQSVDDGRAWFMVKQVSPDLGYAIGRGLPHILSAEALNHPSGELFYYGMDELCLTWHVLAPDQLAKLDALHINRLKTPLPTAGPELCVDMYDPTYQYRVTRVPLTPYRLALFGNSGQWSFTKREATSDPSHSPPSTQAVSRPPFLPPSPSQKNCSQSLSTCQRTSPLWKSFERWSAQQPTLSSGSGPHFYVLTQRWRWSPKSERIDRPYRSVKVPQSKERYLTHRSLVQVTRMGVIAKLSPTGGKLWAWSLMSQHHLSDAHVTVYGKSGVRLADTQTDQNGMAHFAWEEKQSQDEYYLVVEHQGDYAFVTSHSNHQVSYASGDYGEFGNLYQRGQLWTERGIYRLGDSVHFGAALGVVVGSELQPLQQQNCDFTVLNPNGESIVKRKERTSLIGTLSGEFKIPTRSQTGNYQLQVTCPHPTKGLLEWSVEAKVSEFRRPSFTVDAKSSAPQLISGQEVEFAVEGRLLHGSPMRGRRWSALVETHTHPFHPRGQFPYQREGDPEGTMLGRLKLSSFSYGLGSWKSSWHDEQSPELYTALADFFPDLSWQSHSPIKPIHSTGQLNQSGRTSLTLTPTHSDPLPRRITARWTLTDLSAQAMSATSSTIVHPTTGYIGLKNKSNPYLGPDQDHQLEIIWIDALQSSPVSNQQVSLRLFHIEWRHVAIKDEVGRDHIESKRILKPVTRCQIKTQLNPEVCSVDPDIFDGRTGEFIWIAQAKDKQGRSTYSSTKFYRYGDQYTASWRRRSDRQVSLHLTSQQPQVGERLGVLIESPFPSAQAWVTVEREKILYSARHTVGSSTMLWIPITEQMGPNAWVKVVLTRPRITLPYKGYRDEAAYQAWLKDHQGAYGPYDERPTLSSDLGRPLELFGSAQINVPMSQAQLDVTLLPDREVKRPGEQLTLKVSVRDQNKKPVQGEVFVWGVDRGVARLTGYHPPSLIKALYSPRGIRVETFSHLPTLQAHTTLGDKGYPVGGGGFEGSSGTQPTTRSEFRSTPFFIGQAKLDQQGELSFSHPLPDDLTTFNLYAVALAVRSPSSDAPTLIQTGQAQSQVTVNLPLMIRPALPRSLTVGDRFLAGAVVSSLSSKPHTLKVKFSLSDAATPLSQEELEIKLPPHGSQVVKLPYEVRALEPLSVKLTLSEADQIIDSTVTTLKVNPPALPESYRQVGELLAAHKDAPEDIQAKAKTRVALQSPPSSSASSPYIAPKVPSSLAVELGTSVMSSLFGEAKGLIEYPYGCLEQRSSRLIPFALKRYFGERLITEYVSRQGKQATPEEAIRENLTVLSTMQRHRGGFSYWPNSRSRVHTWASAYAMIALHELQQSGINPSPVDLETLHDFLRGAWLTRSGRKTTGSRRPMRKKVSLGEAALISFVLSEYTDEPAVSLEEDLISQRATLSVTDQLLLASALAGPIRRPHAQSRKSMAKELLEEALATFEFDGEQLISTSSHRWDYAYFDSSKRRNALALMAILRVLPDDDRALPLLRALSSERPDRTRLTTQEAAFSLLALRDYVEVREAIPPEITARLTLSNASQQQQHIWEEVHFTQKTPPIWRQARHLILSDDPSSLKVSSSPSPALPEVSELKIDARGKGRLYYSADLTYYPQSARQTPINRGYTLTRQYRVILPAHASTQELKVLLAPSSEELSSEEATRLKAALTPSTLSYQVGDLIEVELSLKLDRSGYYLVINDPLPAGLEVVDPTLKGAVTGTRGPPRSKHWRYFNHIELRDDRVLLFADRLRKGNYTFKYLARATTSGRFIRPAAQVEEMYNPHRAGRSDGGVLWIYE